MLKPGAARGGAEVRFISAMARSKAGIIVNHRRGRVFETIGVKDTELIRADLQRVQEEVSEL